MKKIILSFLVVLNFFSTEAINPKLLKGTHTLVSQKYSPVMGLSFVEWGTAEQWYKFSAKIQAEQLKEALEKNSQAVSKNQYLQNLIKKLGSDKNSATENLILSMFHIAGGTFNVTNADGNPVKYLEPKHIGKLLSVLQKWSQASADPEKMTALKNEALSKKSEYDLKIKDLQKETSRLNAKILTAKKDKKDVDVASLQAELKLKNEELVQNQALLKKIELALKDFAKNSLQQELLDMCMSFEFKNEQSAQFFTEKNWNNFVSSLVGSIQESMGASQSYAENTPEGILLGYMLQKSNTRDDLQNYFRGFLGDNTFVLPINQEYDFDEISQILAAKTDASSFEQLGDLLSAYTYKELYASGLSKVVAQQPVEYKGIKFSDCMDTAIRMLANIVTYQKSEHRVGVVPEGLRLNEAVENFYESENGLCSDAAEVGNRKVHQAWTDVIENVPDCVYAKIGTGLGEVAEIKHEFQGFMPVDHSFTTTAEGKIEIDDTLYEPYHLQLGEKTYTLAQKKVGNLTYLIVPKESGLVCCEMRSNPLNLVTGLNYVFDLNLYSNFEQIFEPDFVSKNFVKICEKFDWKSTGDLSVLDRLKNSIGAITSIPIKTHAGEIFINFTYNQHATVSTKEVKKMNINLEVPETISQASVAAIIGVGLKEIEQLPQDLQEVFLYKDVPALNINQRYKITKQIINSKNILTNIEKNYVQSLIMSFSFVEDRSYLENIVQHCGSEIKKAGLGDFIIKALQLHDAEYKSNVFNRTLYYLIQYKLITEEQGFPLIEKGLSSLDASDKFNLLRIAIDTIGQLVNNNKLLITSDQASHMLPLIVKGMGHINQSILFDASNAMSRLIKKKLITISQVVSLIEKEMNDSSFDVPFRAMDAINHIINDDLITSDQVSQLLPLIEKGMNNSRPHVRSSALSAIRSLVDQKMITKSELENLKKLITSESLKQKIEELKLRAPAPHVTEKSIEDSDSDENYQDMLRQDLEQFELQQQKNDERKDEQYRLEQQRERHRASMELDDLDKKY